MVTTTVRVGESLTIGFYFKNNYQLSNTNVVFGDYFTPQEIILENKNI